MKLLRNLAGYVLLSMLLVGNAPVLAPYRKKEAAISQKSASKCHRNHCKSKQDVNKSSKKHTSKQSKQLKKQSKHSKHSKSEAK